VSARKFLAGFAKSVLVHRHAFVPSPSRTMEIGSSARLSASFDEAFGVPAPKAVDAAIAARRWPAALKLLDAWAAREPRRPEPRVIAGVIRLWAAPGAKTRADVLEGMIDRFTAPAGMRALERAARDFSDWTPARLWLALALLRRNDLPAAWRELDALIARRPDWFWPRLIRSELGRVDIDYDRSLKDLDRAERLEPENAWAAAFLARVLFQKNPGPRASAAMDRAVRSDPKSGWIRAWRADSRRKRGDLRGAASDLAAAEKLEPDYDRIYLWRGKVLRALGRPLEAERALTRGLKTCPHFEKAYAERARARLELGHVDAALSDLEAAVRINHRHNSFFNWTAPIVPLDDARHRTLTALSAHAERNPRSARAWGWLGEALTQAGLFPEGLIALDQALALDPARPRLRTWRGETLMRLGRMIEAEDELNRAVRADPGDGRALAFRGRVRFLAGKAPAAVADLEKAVSDSMVEYSWAYFWRAEAKAAAGDRAGARTDAETAVSLEPRRPEFGALRARLSRVPAGAA
jgi:tetratricopeptide (TPR) repeat protein